MNCRKIANKDSVILAIQNALNDSEDAKYSHRLDLVLLAVSGMPVKEIALLYNEPKNTIHSWINKVEKQGVEALKSGSHPGRPSRVSDEALAQLDLDLQKSPAEFGYDLNLWDGLLLSQHLSDHYSISLQVRQCQRLLRKLGYTLQRPQTKPSGSNPELQEAFKKKLMSFRDHDIWYQDEVHFYRSSTICRMWSKKGKQPQVKSAPTKEKIAFSGFINPKKGTLITNECDRFNFETIMQSVRSFLKHLKGKKKLLVVLDNASWHKKAVRLMSGDPDFARVKFLFLPPYSPELNPIERVWRITRRERTHNRFFAKLNDLKLVLTTYFDKFRGPNAKLKSLCS